MRSLGWDDLGHIAEGLPWFLIGLLVGPWAGLLAVAAFHYGREKVQTEVYWARQEGNRWADQWHRGWVPWEWPKDGFQDWFVPVLFYALIAGLLATF